MSAGWGLKPNTRIVPGRNLLKEVDLQILDPPVCQKVVRSAIQNPEYYWDQESFLCAGGQPEKGLCKVILPFHTIYVISHVHSYSWIVICLVLVACFGHLNH